MAHFDQDVDERCTFCRILYPPTDERETFSHIFRTCRIVEELTKKFIRVFRLPIVYRYALFDPDLDPDPTRDPDPTFDYLYWYGLYDQKNDAGSVVFFELFRYVLWKFKTRRRLPILRELKDIFLNMLETMLHLKPKLRQIISNNNLISNILQALG